MSAVTQQVMISYKAGVTFPTVAATNSGGNGATTTFSAPLPASLVSGDLLLVFVSIVDTGARTVSTPSGWSPLYNTVGGGSLRRGACFYKTSNGGEGATVDITASGSVAFSTTSYRISTGTWQGTPEAGTMATGTSTNPDPPNLGPSWGATSGTLWVASEHDACNSATTPTPPTNYTNQVHNRVTDGTNGDAQCATAQRNLTATSEDPGTFTIGSSGGWGANTIAIRGV